MSQLYVKLVCMCVFSRLPLICRLRLESHLLKNFSFPDTQRSVTPSPWFSLAVRFPTISLCPPCFPPSSTFTFIYFSILHQVLGHTFLSPTEMCSFSFYNPLTPFDLSLLVSLFLPFSVSHSPFVRASVFLLFLLVQFQDNGWCMVMKFSMLLNKKKRKKCIGIVTSERWTLCIVSGPCLSAVSSFLCGLLGFLLVQHNHATFIYAPTTANIANEILFLSSLLCTHT